jgi:hypothetical protein
MKDWKPPAWTQSPLAAAEAGKTAYQYIKARDLLKDLRIRELEKELRAAKRQIKLLSRAHNENTVQS